jgi:oxygen-independent coproporphyrinogen-3 oxidase
VISEQTLSVNDLSFEFMLNALRLTEGFPVQLFSERTGLPISVVEKPLRIAEEQELITWDISSIAPTAKGKLFLNNLLELFVAEDS